MGNPGVSPPSGPQGRSGRRHPPLSSDFGTRTTNNPVGTGPSWFGRGPPLGGRAGGLWDRKGCGEEGPQGRAKSRHPLPGGAVVVSSVHFGYSRFRRRGEFCWGPSILFIKSQTGKNWFPPPFVSFFQGRRLSPAEPPPPARGINYFPLPPPPPSHLLPPNHPPPPPRAPGPTLVQVSVLTDGAGSLPPLTSAGGLRPAVQSA